MIEVVSLAEELVAIPSVSGSETAVVDHVSDLLESRGWTIRRQQVTADRDNVWASRAGHGVTLSTHLDTVPPFFPPRIEDGKLYGRGSCDAKGIAAAMMCAAERLAEAGEDRVDLLFVIGEENGSDGAIAANQLPATSLAFINGEPTEGRLASGSKGSLRALVETVGEAGHSAYPERGHSAIDAMVRLLATLDELTLPTDPTLGDTTINVGTIDGGEAANVIASACRAQLLVRLVGDDAPVRAALDAWVNGRATIHYSALVPATRFQTVEGFEIAPVSFTTDVPLLDRWGRALLYGPGSIHQAHRPDEHIIIEELRKSVNIYEQLVKSLLPARRS